MWYALVAFIPGKNACANHFNVEGDAARRESVPPSEPLPKK